MKTGSPIIFLLLIPAFFWVSCAGKSDEKQKRPTGKPRTIERSPAPRGVRKIPATESTGQVPPSWIAGRLDEALSRARTSGHPVLVFWNAKWCPPCNQVKLQVIHNPHFAKLVSGTVLLWLDGDAPGAQRAGQRLGLRGYPTLLLLDENGKELMRMVGAVTFSDFQSVYLAATSRDKPLRQILEHGTKGGMGPGDWLLLAYHDWDLDASKDPVAVLSQLIRLNDNVPSAARTARAMLAGRTLEIAARLAQDAGKKPSGARSVSLQRLIRHIRIQAPKLLDRLLAPGSGPGTAEFLLYWNRTILQWIGCGAVRRGRVLERWRKKLDLFSQHQGLGASDRLWAAFARIQNAHLCDPQTKRQGTEPSFATYRKDPAAAKVASMAKSALASASNRILRHTLVSTAAEILARTQGPEAAEHVLLAEAHRSDTPWYYWAALAWLYEEEQKPKEALDAGARAARTARGRATRIQWLSSQVLRILRLAPGGPALAPAIKALVDALLADSDSWVGRNGDKVRRLIAAIDQFCRGQKTSRIRLTGKQNKRLATNIQAAVLRQATRLRQQCSPGQAPCLDLVEALKRLSVPHCLGAH